MLRHQSIYRVFLLLAVCTTLAFRPEVASEGASGSSRSIASVLIERAEEALKQDGHLTEDVRVEITPRWIPSRLSNIQPGQIRSVQPKPGDIRGYTVFEVETPNGTVDIQLHVLYQQYLPVLAERRRSGEVLTSADFHWRWVDVTRGTLDYIRMPEDADGLQLRRTLNAGSPVRANDAWTTPDVEAGTIVEVLFENDGMQIVIPARARQSGHAGDKIRVHSNETRRTYLVEVQAPGQVIWKQTL